MTTASSTTDRKIEPATDAESLLSGMWTAAAMEARYPLNSREAVKLLRSGGGFDALPDLLDSWARTKAISAVAVSSQGFSWSAENILQCVSLLNASRRWLLASGHIHKMTAVELAELQARQIGQTIFNDLDAIDCRSLLGLIAAERTDNDTRQILCRAILTKLEMAGVV